jgi:hypothetical protein
MEGGPGLDMGTSRRRLRMGDVGVQRLVLGHGGMVERVGRHQWVARAERERGKWGHGRKV